MTKHVADGGGWSLRRLMTEVVGSGHKSADDMDRDQAREAMQRILEGEPAPVTLGGFWLANRWKRNTPEELAAFTDVMREESVEVASPSCEPVDCGANYDGKPDSALLGVASGLVAAAAGTPVVAHSGDRVPTQKATAYKHVLAELGVRTDLSPQESAEMTDDVGFGFYYQPRFNPGITALRDDRADLGVRTFCNTIETLANPADAAVHLGSFYHLPFAKRICNTFREMDSQTVDRVVMFQGMEGYDDVRPGQTVVADWRGGDVEDFEIPTTEYGLNIERAALEVEDVAVDSARITEAVLSGERTDHFADAVALNAALRLYADDAVEDITAGVEQARQRIDDGSAAERLAQLREF